MRTCFCTIAQPEYMQQAEKLIASAKHFHPEIEMHVINPSVDYAIAKSTAIAELLNTHERVICFDADSIIVGALDELLSATEYDIVSVRNNNDYDKAGMNEPITQEGIEVDKYLNGGLISVTNKAFIAAWVHGDRYYAKHMQFGSQTVFNALAADCNTHIIDHKDSGTYYGVSGLYGTYSHWDSWKDIYVENGRLILQGKTIKVLHHAGGAVDGKLDFNLFHHTVQNRLREICN